MKLLNRNITMFAAYYTILIVKANPLSSDTMGPQSMCIMCNNPCNVESSMCKANCSHQQLDQVPANCHDVTDLYLNQNSIHRVSVQDFEDFRKLSHLRIRDNGIESIEENSFANTRLDYIDFSDNHLHELPSNIFTNLKNVTHIILTNNNINLISPDAFSNTTNLTYLRLDKNTISDIPSHIFQNTKIVNLLLSYNYITELRNDMFGHLSNLKYLELAHNPITVIHLKAFTYLNNLQKINLTGIQIHSIQNNQFEKQRNLQDLDLSQSGIKFINYNALHSLRELRTFSIAGNRLTNGLPNYLFNSTPKLDHLNISGMGLKTLHARIFSGLQFSLNVLSAENNLLSDIENDTFTYFIKLQIVNLTNNKLSSNISNALSPLIQKEYGEPAWIYLEGNPICEHYNKGLHEYYNKSIFCSPEQMNEYLNKRPISTNSSEATNKDEQNTQKIMFVILGVIGLLLALNLLIFYFRSKRLRPHERNSGSVIFSSSNTPPPVPERSLIRPPLSGGEGFNQQIVHTCTSGTQSSACYMEPLSEMSSQRASNYQDTCTSYISHSYTFPKSINGADTEQTITITGTNYQDKGMAIVHGLPSLLRNYSNRSSQHKKYLWQALKSHGTIDDKPITSSSNESEIYMVRNETEDGRPTGTINTLQSQME